jgi:hypothetical protein
MYPIHPPAVYAHEHVMAHPAYRARVERVVAALRTPRAIRVYSDEQLPALVREDGLAGRRVPMGTLPEIEDPVLLFNTFRFDDEEAVRERARRWKEQDLEVGHDLLGTGAFHWFDANLRTDPHRGDKVCRPCWRIHWQEGCLHKCLYCGLGGLLVSAVNIEEYCRHLERLIERHPWQTTYLLDDDGDPPCLEPELGCLGPLIEFFGALPQERYLIIHTKTWNTDWLRGLKHNGRTIIVWSLSGSTQSRLIERDTGTTEQRVEAAHIAQEAGYTVRYKFKPILPVRGWREDAAAAVELALGRTRPDILSLCCFMWMDVDEMKRRLAPVLDLLDPEFLRLAEESREEASDTRAQPFPHAARARVYEHYLAEIRRRDPQIPVSLSTENFKMWSAFSERLGMTATNYVCGCGPQCVPGAKRLEVHPFQVAVRSDYGLPGVRGPAPEESAED